MTSAPLLTRAVTAERLLLAAKGPWTAAHAEQLERLVEDGARDGSAAPEIAIDMSAVRDLDTLGAWLLERLSRSPQFVGKEVRLTGVATRYRGLIGDMHAVNRQPAAAARGLALPVAALDVAGRAAAGVIADLTDFLQMLGELSVAVGGILLHPRRLRLTSAVYHLFRVGWQAVPIMALITFLIGGIIAQQGFFHFRKFGADAYVVDMVGILVVREIGVLIVSIMSAGRSGSAYTAELGSMTMREEIDALRTMGLDPVEILILPRIAALVCALPVLSFIGAMAALYGGGVVAWFYGGMSPAVYLARLKEAISVTHFEVGMIKAPFMALAVGIVACSEGLKVKGSAESLGLQTTTSVVKAIFLVIVLDGLFAMFFASVGM
ncbi:MAG: ABC transporter permease [Bradyrhizobiaceae bacterium]|nr:ABC transporter permease [Bradyrhizobiaceae bacterium]